MVDDDAKKNFKQSVQSLPNRPDYDGKLTWSKATSWYRNGKGKSLYVDASKIDLSDITTQDFDKVGDSKYINFDFQGTNMQTALVYGTIKVTLMTADGTAKLGGKGNYLDTYDFDPQIGRKMRNVFTKLGGWVAGTGTGFKIYDYGTAKVSTEKVYH